jgi:hypothetical protein
MPILLSISKADLSANGKLVPMGARRFKRQNQQMSMLQLLANSNLANLTGAHLKPYALAQAIETLGGFDQFGLYEKFGAVMEQQEMQLVQSAAEEQTVATLSQPGINEF